METTSGAAAGLLGLPQGGGAMRGIGERFQPDRLRGSGGYAIPLPQPKGPNELSPSLTLKYSTGQGNGPFGVGWSLGGPLDIRRRTDRGVPSYDDGDAFTIAGADVLVPVGGGRYRPASETQGWLIERTGEGWTITTKERRTYTLGATAQGRIADGDRVFAWLVEEERDLAGNAIAYRWDHDAGAAYLAEVAWGPFAVRLRYEDRPDPVHDGRAGFPIRTRRRCAAIERFADAADQPLLARHALSYAQAEGSGVSLLAAVQLTGHGADGATEDAPPIRLGYSALRPRAARLVPVRGPDGPMPPLDDPATTLVDMDGDGLADVLQTGEGEHRWWRNRGDGTFDPPRRMAGQPPGMVVGRRGVTFADVDGDGTADLVRTGRTLTTVARNTGAGAWAQARASRHAPALDVSGDRTRMVDLDGDGVTDVLQLGRRGAIATYNRKGEGWSAPEARVAAAGTSPVPAVDLAAPDVRLADMTGDGLTDVVHVASGRIEFWPSYGRTTWGEPVRMASGPVLPRGYDLERLHLVDLDGDGVADLLYVDGDRLLLWLNRCGSAWSDAYEIPYVPPPDPRSLQLVDLLGTGTRGLLWSAGHRRGGGYLFLDLNGGAKPNLLTAIDHGQGGKSEIRYTTSTAMRAADEAAGAPWRTFLPFALQVVAEIVERDAVTGVERRTAMRYHDGVWAGADREFRGFGRVETTRRGDAATPDVVEETTFQIEGDRALSGSPVRVRVFEQAADGTRTLVRTAALTWAARVEHDAPAGRVAFPHTTSLEAREHAPGEPDRIDRAAYEYDAAGNLVVKRRTARFDGQPDADALRTEERLAYAVDADGRRTGLLASIELRDGDGRLLKATRHHYDGPAFEGLPLGQAPRGVLRRTRELMLADWSLPPGYASEIEPGWGLVHEGEGWWRTAGAFDHDARGNVVAQRDGLGAERRIAYDAGGVFPVRLTDVDGSETTATFDLRSGEAAEVVFADGRRTRYGHSPLGRLAATHETAGDGTLQLTEVNRIDHGDPAATPPRPARAVTWKALAPGVSEDDLPDPETAALPRDATVACDYYDSFGNLLQRVQRAPGETGAAPRWVVSKQREHTVDGRAAADRPDAFVDGPGFAPGAAEPVRFAYGPLGETRSVTMPGGERMRMRRLPSRLERRDALTADADPATVERLDAFGHLVGVDEPDGAGGVLTTAYDVDPLGRTVAIHDAGGRVSARYAYSGPGRPVRVEHADAGVRSTYRDAAERVRLRVDSTGQRLAYDYDVHGRMVGVRDVTDAAAPVTLRTIEFAGARLVRARDGDVETRFEYDAAGRAVARTLDDGTGEPLTIRREHGLHGEVRAIVYPDGTRVEYERDATGALASAPGWVEGVEYDAHGAPVRLDLPGGAAARYAFDPVTRRMTGAALDGAGGTLRDLRFTHDAVGRVTAMEDALAAARLQRTFAYDALSRLASAELREGTGPSAAHGYAYSPTGDLTRNGESATTATMEYGDAAHAGRLTRLRSAQGATVGLEYDDGGRMTALGDGLALEYDAFDRLVAGRLADGTKVRFAYDAHGLRVRKEVERAGAVERTRYAEDLYETGPAGTRLTVLFGRLVVGERVTGAGGETRSASLLTDHLRTVLSACDHAGALVSEQAYSPFGRPLRGGRDGYAGAASDDDLGLVQFGARWYAPALGRFITPDWFVIDDPSRAQRTPQALNAYSYAVNSPLVLRDPTGMWFGLDDAIVAAVGFVVGFIVGVIVGIADGRSAGDVLLLGLEAGLLGAVGAWLAWNTAGAALGLLGVSSASGAGAAIVVGAAAVGGLNGVISGASEIYDWGGGTGFLAFALDSSWGLLGTALGLVVHTINLFYGSDRRYNTNESKRKDRHVYDGGFGFGNFAFQQGNVISNLEGRHAPHSDLIDHEFTHVWQSRGFGPIFTLTYVGWMLGGVVVGFLAGLFTGQGIGKDIEDMAYHNNPWEGWAYEVGGSHKGGELAWW